MQFRVRGLGFASNTRTSSALPFALFCVWVPRKLSPASDRILFLVGSWFVGIDQEDARSFVETRGSSLEDTLVSSCMLRDADCKFPRFDGTHPSVGILRQRGTQAQFHACVDAVQQLRKVEGGAPGLTIHSHLKGFLVH